MAMPSHVRRPRRKRLLGFRISQKRGNFRLNSGSSGECRFNPTVGRTEIAELFRKRYAAPHWMVCQFVYGRFHRCRRTGICPRGQTGFWRRPIMSRSKIYMRSAQDLDFGNADLIPALFTPDGTMSSTSKHSPKPVQQTLKAIEKLDVKGVRHFVTNIQSRADRQGDARTEVFTDLRLSKRRRALRDSGPVGIL